MARIAPQKGAVAAPPLNLKTKTQAPTPVEDEVAAGLRALLRIEADVREATSVGALFHLIANETRKLTRARQIFVCRIGRGGRPAVVAVSGLATVDPSAPMVHAVEVAVTALGRDAGLEKLREFEASAYAAAAPELAKEYPFRSLLWLPFAPRNGNPLGGMLLARETSWTEADVVVASRLSATYAHALGALREKSGVLSALSIDRRMLVGIAAIASLLLAIPVSMTVLAPAEIVARSAFVVAAPIEGIIEDVPVEPNATVATGQPLVRFVDTTLRNRLSIADREMNVAESRVQKATQQAFTDVRARHDLGVAMAELALKTAERDYARELLGRSQVAAPQAGVAVFTDKKQLIGKPVGVGERILLLADPSNVEVQIDVAVGDAVTLGPGARVKLFLDSDPLQAREAKVELADYQARVRPGNIVAFRVVAGLAGADRPPRLGGRGTAQIYGETVPLFYYLFRRPLSALRQWSGW